MEVGNRSGHPDARSGYPRGGQEPQDRMKQFKAVWERFAADEANLTEFLNMKRKRRDVR